MRTLLRVIALGIGLAALAGVAAVGWRLSGSVSVVERTGPAPGGREPRLSPSPADWPCWRGPHGNGVSDDPDPPLTWSATENVRWRVPVPGRGHASPVVWGDRVFVATADESEGTQSLVCYDRADGRQVWATEVHRGGLMAKHAKNSHASATPACDGRRVYVAFARAGAIWVSAVDMADGRIAWQAEAGPFVTEWGYGSSPALSDDLVIVAGDSRRSKLGRLQALAFLATLDRDTGAIAWRIRRPEEHSFGTPVVGRVAGRDQLLLADPQAVNSYDPGTGRDLWHANWSVNRAANTVAFDGDRVFATGAYPDKQTLCIRGDGAGDVTETHVAWRAAKYAGDVPSLLAHGGRLFVASENGILTCAAADTGKVIWQERVGTAVSSSPVWAADRVYVTAEDGRTTVVPAGGPFKVLARNALGEDVLTTPVFSGGAAFIRSVQSLWCIGLAK